ncbi:hypothetical protein GCM10026987_20030 [Belliella aquatica]|uniref:DNA methylase adenine-specific domain-containing protein n=1 Tax=Belliella aquatica TaxID=1323734 RepID=A0ABQ1N3R2_9BACT|nr:hypothetical protein GCM10010993_33400 [Belliella aquatica]
MNKNKKAKIVQLPEEIRKYRDREKEVLFMDLRQTGIPFEKKFIQFSEDDIIKVTETYHIWQSQRYAEEYENIPEYCYAASLEEIRAKDYSLVPSKYIEFVNRDENLDFDEKMKALQSEFKELLEQEEASKKELLEVFKTLGYEIG